MEKATVQEYMSKNVVTVQKEENIENLSELISETGHDGFPVCEDGRLVGYVCAKNIIVSGQKNSKVEDIMDTEYPTIKPDLSVKTTGRIMFREGIEEILVVENGGLLQGIITHNDIIRSQIERTTPSKVASIKSTIEQIHNNIDIDIKKRKVKVNSLHPTQSEVYMNELTGRKYELDNGLSEPIVVIQDNNKTVIADGHHRALASKKLGRDTIVAYCLVCSGDIDLGMYQNAVDRGIDSLDDICIISGEDHPDTKSIELISDLRID